MDQILYPIMWVVAWIMTGAHWVFARLGFGDGPGIAWVLAIVALTIVMRTALIPLFVKQIKASRGMQIMQPELQAVQKKYKGKSDPSSREAMTRETMELYKKHGTNPFASCLPLLLQSPIFFALFRVLNNLPAVAAGPEGVIAAGNPGAGNAGRGPVGPIDANIAHDIMESDLFGARMSDIFLQTDNMTARVVVISLIVLMSVTTFTTQRQLTMKNMPKAALEGPMASTQKIMLYALPLVFAVSGVNFPVGVLIYWTVTNIWSMGQQFYTIKRMPAPGSEAERMLKEKQARKLAAKGITPEVVAEVPTERPAGQRVQPKRKNRQKKG